MPASQATRSISVDTVLGPDALLLARMAAEEHLSRPFEYELALLSERHDIRAEDLLGTPATASLRLASGGHRFFNGFVNRFAYVGFAGTYALYRANLAPWIWFLSRTSDCRIYQDQTVPEIVKSVFRDHGFTDFAERLSGTYRPWTYCVQYRETDLNFVQRLLEHEGIYYFHEQADGKHTLVLADDRSAHTAAPGYEQVVYFPPGQTQPHDLERINDWSVATEVRPGAFAHTAFDFTAPRKNLLARRSAPKQHAQAGLEVFDFQGDYIETADGEGYARIRLEEHQAEHALAEAAGNARGLACGGLFTLTEHPRDDQNGEYLIVAASYRLHSDDYGSVDSAPPGPVFACNLSAMDAQIPYRPPRATPKPTVRGPQTAVVVGKAGEEIWTDKYGRVKVQFHWDRYGKADETSSCWVRVAQAWAGKNWGGMMIPRIGQEVIVDFLEGDPDQPIITGRVYNGDQMPPWDLPANMTQSGLLTRSSKGGAGANANAIRFEDKKGAEQLWLHAEKNQDIEVENDETHWVGHDRTKTIDHDETTHVKHDRTETVDNNETITIHGNRTETVDKNERITIGGGRTENVAKDESITIGGGRTENVAKDESITIGGGRTEAVAEDESITIGSGRTENVGKDESITIGGGRTENVAKDERITIGGGRTGNVGKNESVTIGEARTVSIGKDDRLSVGKNLSITAADSITITTGSASITMKKDGTITIKGKDITIEGSGKINAKASGNITMKGSKILQN
ncbi:type VI secretion system Vgr family protein [uncultured Lamprocystis sp.]|jgi:type VI secretion system secreted protein VgrG|uniref:type VI secretion system Vgr family protein n=1 Tax=uncultured Lamprocystis sp. TaxID=543132 RepID=UPI0025DF9C9A|nr:type VI secretion system tip protein VgrG [uncultured Lamprocystis sp.]